MIIKISGGTDMERVLAGAYYAVSFGFMFYFEISKIGGDNVYTIEELKNGDIEYIIHIPISKNDTDTIIDSVANINKAAEEHGSDIHVEVYS